MKSRLLSTAAVIGSLAGLSGTATAQTQPLPSVYNWSGCYVGTHAGYGWGDANAITFGGFGPPSSISADMDGWAVGAQAGCDWQVTPNFVLGVEGLAAWTDIDGSSDPFFANKNVFSSRTNWIASATARAGFNADSWLFYVKGGRAWSENDYRIHGTFGGIPFDDRGSDTRSAWTWGVGLEWVFAPNWTAKLEYNHYDFDRSSVLLGDSIVDAKADVRTVTVGFNYRFATGRP